MLFFYHKPNQPFPTQPKIASVAGSSPPLSPTTLLSTQDLSVQVSAGHSRYLWPLVRLFVVVASFFAGFRSRTFPWTRSSSTLVATCRTHRDGLICLVAPWARAVSDVSADTGARAGPGSNGGVTMTRITVLNESCSASPLRSRTLQASSILGKPLPHQSRRFLLRQSVAVDIMLVNDVRLAWSGKRGPDRFRRFFAKQNRSVDDADFRLACVNFRFGPCRIPRLD